MLDFTVPARITTRSADPDEDSASYLPANAGTALLMLEASFVPGLRTSNRAPATLDEAFGCVMVTYFIPPGVQPPPDILAGPT
jgi:hypothetical protein